MSVNPNKISQFFQELKRRRVFKVVAMYAAAAFIILDVLDVATLMLRLPDWTPKFVVVLLAIGFLVTAILAWFYDFTHEGLKLTKALTDSYEEVPESTHTKWKLKVSDVVIGVLIVAVCILAYPRIFRSQANLKVMTTSLTYKNEAGDKESKRIFKDEFIQRISLFGFENTNQDASNYWMSTGITDMLRENFIQFNYIILPMEWSWITRLNEQLDLARSVNSPYFLTGSYVVNEDIIELTSRLYETSSGALEAERVFSGGDLLSIVDSVSLHVRRDLGISPIILNSSADVPTRDLMTDSQEALRYGAIWWGPDSGTYYAHRAVELDSTYALVYSVRAGQLYNNAGSIETAREYANNGVRHRHRLSDIRDMQLRIRYYRINGEEEKAIETARVQHELQPSNYRYLLDLILLYDQNFLLEEMEKAVKKLIKLVPDNPDYEFMLVRSYLYSGKLNKGLKLLEKILKRDPTNGLAMMRMGEFYLQKDDLKSATENFEKAILLSPEKEAIWSPMLDHIEYRKNHPGYLTHLESLAGLYRIEGLSEMMMTQLIHNNQLLGKNFNAVYDILYPTSDFTTYDYISLLTTNFVKDSTGRVIKKTLTQRGQTFIGWKEDSLVGLSMKQLHSEQYSEALASFRMAVDQHPSQFYLANYIDHLESILDEGYQSMGIDYDSFTGTYNGRLNFESGSFDMKLYRKNDRYYIVDHQGRIFELLPMSESRFMVPSFLNMHIQILMEKETVSGLEIVYRDGRKTFCRRLN